MSILPGAPPPRGAPLPIEQRYPGAPPPGAPATSTVNPISRPPESNAPPHFLGPFPDGGSRQQQQEWQRNAERWYREHPSSPIDTQDPYGGTGNPNAPRLVTRNGQTYLTEHGNERLLQPGEVEQARAYVYDYAQKFPSGNIPGSPPPGAPAPGAQLPNAYAGQLEGFDSGKLGDLTHTSPKYVFARIAQQYNVADPAQRQAMLAALRADPSGYFRNATLSGSKGDVLEIGGTLDPRFGGVSRFDIIRAAGEGGKGWQWGGIPSGTTTTATTVPPATTGTATTGTTTAATLPFKATTTIPSYTMPPTTMPSPTVRHRLQTLASMQQTALPTQNEQAIFGGQTATQQTGPTLGDLMTDLQGSTTAQPLARVKPGWSGTRRYL